MARYSHFSSRSRPRSCFFKTPAMDITLNKRFRLKIAMRCGKTALANELAKQYPNGMPLEMGEAEIRRIVEETRKSIKP